MEVAGFAHAGVELHVLAVAERRKRFTLAGVEGHLGAGSRIEFQKEALALARNGGRLDDAPGEDDDLAAGGVEFRRGAGAMGKVSEGAAAKEAE